MSVTTTVMCANMDTTDVIANTAAIHQAFESAARSRALFWLRCLEITVATAVALDIPERTPEIVLKPAHQMIQSTIKCSKIQLSHCQQIQRHQQWAARASSPLLELRIVYPR